jgi:SWI/SNF-related matrix-associated actin-dependent regulator of chromatin subfamily A member 5
MLRRLKLDVETEIPPKKEIYVECGMSVMQKEWYKSILTKDSQNILAIKGREKLRLLNIVMQLRKVCNHPYLVRNFLF